MYIDEVYPVALENIIKISEAAKLFFHSKYAEEVVFVKEKDVKV
jgi:hypothetical protein